MKAIIQHVNCIVIIIQHFLFQMLGEGTVAGLPNRQFDNVDIEARIKTI